MESKFHAVTIIITAVSFMIMTFSSESPLLLFSELCFFIISFVLSGRSSVIKKDITIFIPFFIVTSIINAAFSPEGGHIIFKFLGKIITFEALTYGLIFSFKLLIIILCFSYLSNFIDSDRALTYFSSKVPKSAFMFLISFKLFPTMKNYLQDLKEIYAMRGVSHQEKKLTSKIKGYLPMVSVLLENSMEKAFDLGEAAYVRGFFSGRRSSYDRQRFNGKDFIFLSVIFSLLLGFIILKLHSLDVFDIYNSESTNVLNTSAVILCLCNAAAGVVFYLLIRDAGERNELS